MALKTWKTGATPVFHIDHGSTCL